MQVVPLDERVKQLNNIILPALLNMYETEDNKLSFRFLLCRPHIFS
jgi:hypothetical protein